MGGGGMNVLFEGSVFWKILKLVCKEFRLNVFRFFANRLRWLVADDINIFEK